jgi:hypothetical protein
MEAEVGRKMCRGGKTGCRGKDELKLHILIQQRNGDEDEFIKRNLRKTCTVFYSDAYHG